MEAEPRTADAPSRNMLQISRAPLPVAVEPGRRNSPGGRRRRWVVLLAIALAAAALVWAAGQYWLRPLDVTAVHPARGVAIDAVYATGIIEAIDFARLGSTVAARVVELTVDEGDNVQRGQVVARLDDREARARLADARARLTLAQAEISRDETLLNRGFLPLQSLQRAEEERDQAAANVDLDVRQVEDYTIVAPLDGVVMKRLVEPGETVAANAPLFEIHSTARLRVAADVDERDIALVRLGAELAARADGFPDEAFPANVTRIRRQGDASSRTFRVEADLPADTKLMIGMTVDVDIVTSQRQDALLVPTSAVAHGPAQGGRPGAPYLFKVEQGRARRVPIQTGAVGAAKVEILAGATQDDLVILNPDDRLKDGRAVRATP